MNPDSLLTLSKKLESGDLGYIDGMLIIRNGKIIFEEQYSNNYDSLFNTTNTEPGKYNYYDPNWHPYYKGTRLHTMQSVSKSFTAAAIGIADQKWGERPLVLIVARDEDLDATTVRNAFSQAADEGLISRWAVPERIEIVDAIPKTSVGKIDKKLLRQQYAA